MAGDGDYFNPRAGGRSAAYKRQKCPTPLANVPEFGVVGSFELAPQANPSECLVDELITEVDAVLCD